MNRSNNIVRPCRVVFLAGKHLYGNCNACCRGRRSFERLPRTLADKFAACSSSVEKLTNLVPCLPRRRSISFVTDLIPRSLRILSLRASIRVPSGTMDRQCFRFDYTAFSRRFKLFRAPNCSLFVFHLQCVPANWELSFFFNGFIDTFPLFEKRYGCSRLSMERYILSSRRCVRTRRRALLFLVSSAVVRFSRRRRSVENGSTRETVNGNSGFSRTAYGGV